jgi:hypothetical protein
MTILGGFAVSESLEGGLLIQVRGSAVPQRLRNSSVVDINRNLLHLPSDNMVLRPRRQPSADRSHLLITVIHAAVSCVAGSHRPQSHELLRGPADKHPAGWGPPRARRRPCCRKCSTVEVRTQPHSLTAATNHKPITHKCYLVCSV